jgi:S-DNA-T family DNA segregation ATPase FtsK/SpoIIIE
MTAVQRKKEQAKAVAPRFNWPVAWSILFGGLALLTAYVAALAPADGMLSGMRAVMRGLGGHLFVLFPFALLWLCVLAAFAASGKKISPLRVMANLCLVFCFYAAVELFHVERLMVDKPFLSWADGVAKAYRGMRGGGAFGALIAVPLYTYLGAWGGLIAVLVLATLLLAATGALAKFSRMVKNGSHTAEQKSIQRRANRMFEPAEDTILDDPFPQRPVKKPTQGAKSAQNAKRKLYTEDFVPATAAAGLASAPVEAPPVQEPKPAARANAEYVPGTKPRPSTKKATKVDNQVSVEELKIEPDDYEPKEIPLDEIPFDLPAANYVKPVKKLKHAPAPAASEVPDPESVYNYPPIDMLQQGMPREADQDNEADLKRAKLLEESLRSFGIQTKLTGIAHGPAVTRFELQPAPGVKVSRITALADDIALNLAAVRVRIEAPIPGKAAVGVEVPNDKVETVPLRSVLESPDACRHTSRVAVGLGKDNSGRFIVADIAKMPHVLIAGQTGSGKSVCINSIIMSILYRATPDEVKLILIDPKVVELSVYNEIPHLIAPVVTDPKKAASALDWAVVEMLSRYKKFGERGVRDLKHYNSALKEGEKPMPQIVIIIDELADLMLVAPGEVQDSICRLTQLARAAGMHLVIATQRPSVNVITGVIKANIPTRIAFLVASQVDSRTIIDHGGAEKLLGYGDMLFVPSGIQKPMRVQGAWVSDEEVHAVVEHIKAHHGADYDEDVTEKIESAILSDAEKNEEPDEADPRLPEAIDIVMEAGQASISMLQRRMRVGYSRAGRLIDDMFKRGIVSEADGAKPRTVLITREEYRRLFEDGE